MPVSSLKALLVRGRGTTRQSFRSVTGYKCCIGELIRKVRPEWVTAPYPKCMYYLRVIPSNAGTVKAGVNLWGPPHKTKYSLATDSEPVP